MLAWAVEDIARPDVSVGDLVIVQLHYALDQLEAKVLELRL